MSNYTATARTNYFRVKDRAAFSDWVDSVRYQELSILVHADPQLVGLNATNGDCSGFQIDWQDDDGAEHNLLAELAQHLAEGAVAVLVEAGSEKCRYVTGFAIAVKADPAAEGGFKTLKISLGDIYRRVQSEWGCAASQAIY